MGRWQDDWTNKVEAKKKLKPRGWDVVTRMFNCMKMYGLSKTSEGLLIVRDHRSIGEPTIFWTHNLKRGKRVVQKATWKVEDGTTKHEAGRVLKYPESMNAWNKQTENYEHGLVHPKALVDDSCNAFKDVLEECMRIVGVDEHHELVVAIKKYKEQEEKINNVVAVRNQLHESKQGLKETQHRFRDALHEATEAHPALGIIQDEGTLSQRQRKRRRQRSRKAAATSAASQNDESSSAKRQRLLEPAE